MRFGHGLAVQVVSRLADISKHGPAHLCAKFLRQMAAAARPEIMESESLIAAVLSFIGNAFGCNGPKIPA